MSTWHSIAKYTSMVAVNLVRATSCLHHSECGACHEAQRPSDVTAHQA